MSTAVAVGMLSCPAFEEDMPPSLIEEIRASIQELGVRFLTGVFPQDKNRAFRRMCAEAGAAGEQIIHQPWRTADDTTNTWPHYLVVFGKANDSTIIIELIMSNN